MLVSYACFTRILIVCIFAMNYVKCDFSCMLLEEFSYLAGKLFLITLHRKEKNERLYTNIASYPVFVSFISDHTFNIFNLRCPELNLFESFSMSTSITIYYGTITIVVYNC